MFKITPTPNTIRTYQITRQMGSNTKTGTRQGLYKFGSLLYKELRADILRRKNGKQYIVRRGTTRGRHIASAVGETPANLSGNLRRSVDFKVQGSSNMEFGYDKSVDYGKYLESGTKKMGARPGLKNNIDKNLVNGANIIGQEVYNSMMKK